MRVLLVSKLFPRPEKTLSGTFVLEQAKSLADCGVSVEVVSPRPRQLLSRVLAGSLRGESNVRSGCVDGIPVLYMDYLHVPLRVSTRFEACSLVRQLCDVVGREHQRARIDVLHAHQLFPTGYATAVVGRRLGIPVVCTAHGSDVHTHPDRNRGIARYTRTALRSVDHLVAVSADLASRISTLEPQSAPVDVIYNGVDLHRFAPAVDRVELRHRLGLPVSGTGICTVSRLAEAKGIPELVSAFRAVLKANSDVWLVIVGGGPLESRLRSWVGDLDGHLVVTGPIEHAQVPQYLKAADVFALPSHREGVPVAMLEAMACGLPVVVTAVGGIPEVVTDGSTGLLIHPRDEHELAESLNRLVRDVALRRRMGTAAQEVIRNGFQWNQGSAKLASLYAALAAPPEPVGGDSPESDLAAG
jgi:teichuronic acid biosynthesis glycosyltransferase TuaC